MIPGIAGMSVMATTFNALAINLTFRREQGLLKRVRGTPMPAGSYFAGFLGNAVANACVQVALVIVIGHLLYDVTWPRDWPELIVFTLVGRGHLRRAGDRDVARDPQLRLRPGLRELRVPARDLHLGGLLLRPTTCPPVLDAVARALPLKHVIDGFSGAIVEGSGLGADLGSLAVVAAWGAAAVLLAIRGFRWE